MPFLPVTGTPPADRNAATVGINHANESASAAAGLTPGALVHHAGVGYRWPDTAAGERDNYVAAGRTFTIAAAGATKVGLLGAADGSARRVSRRSVIPMARGKEVMLGFTDWTRAGGQVPIQYGNTVVAALPYRNFTVWGGGRDYTTTYGSAPRSPCCRARRSDRSPCRRRSAAAGCTSSRWAPTDRPHRTSEEGTCLAYAGISSC